MKADELKQLCKFQGKDFDYSDDEVLELALQLSHIERNVCDMLLRHELQPEETPRQVFDDYVAAMIGKWHPYECNELWELYSSK